MHEDYSGLEFFASGTLEEVRFVSPQESLGQKYERGNIQWQLTLFSYPHGFP